MAQQIFEIHLNVNAFVSLRRWSPASFVKLDEDQRYITISKLGTFPLRQLEKLLLKCHAGFTLL